jgi:hypothetical protein
MKLKTIFLNTKTGRITNRCLCFKFELPVLSEVEVESRTIYISTEFISKN